MYRKISADAKDPRRATPRSAGLDLYSTVNLVIPAHGIGRVPTGIEMEMPEGYYGRVAPRSSLAVRYGIDVKAGVIDGDYRDEIIVVLRNDSDVDFQVESGDRIAQLVITKYYTGPLKVVTSKLSTTERGKGGFGSTGI